MKSKLAGDSDDYEVIYVKSFRHYKTGKIVKASDFGKKAIPLRIKKK